MSQSDEKPVEEENVAEAHSEDNEEGPEVEGHKLIHEPSKLGEPGKTFKAS